jgi:hypothetical protein
VSPQGSTSVNHRGYQVSIFWAADAFPQGERASALAAMDHISTSIWQIDPRFFVAQIGSDLFTADDILAAIYFTGQLVGFSSYRRLRISNCNVLFQRYTAIHEDHHKQGLYHAVTGLIVRREYRNSSQPLFYSWRTRSPVMWFANVRYCRRIAADLASSAVDEELLCLGAAVASRMYPGLPLDARSLRISDAYPGDSSRYHMPQHHRDARLDQLFYRQPAITTPHDALIGVGELARMEAVR